MSLFGLNTHYSLKDLLENPILQNPPNLKKDGNGKPKEEGGLSTPRYDPTSAFLGPNIWSSPQYTDGDISLEYMDLDEFLSENGIPVDASENSNGSNSNKSNVSSVKIGSPIPSESDSKPFSSLREGSISSTCPSSPLSDQEDTVEQTKDPDSPRIKIDFEIGEGERELVNVPGEESFDPKARKFSADELKPQPMIKKSRKIFVPDEQKDDKYWNRRKKNNVAAKRSRDARRVKENQIAMRACYLEKCNQTLAEELQKVKKENAQLKKTLEEYEKKLNNV